MGSQLEIDMDPDGDLTVVPRHQGQTGTGCYKLHDHRIFDFKVRRDKVYGHSAPDAPVREIPDEDKHDDGPHGPAELAKMGASYALLQQAQHLLDMPIIQQAQEQQQQPTPPRQKVLNNKPVNSMNQKVTVSEAFSSFFAWSPAEEPSQKDLSMLFLQPWIFWVLLFDRGGIQYLPAKLAPFRWIAL